jgi:hypothetical protein
MVSTRNFECFIKKATSFMTLINRGRIHNTSFSSSLKNRPNKLDCYITLSGKGLSVINTLTYWASSWVTKKMKFWEYGPRVIKTVKLI